MVCTYAAVIPCRFFYSVLYYGIQFQWSAIKIVALDKKYSCVILYITSKVVSNHSLSAIQSPTGLFCFLYACDMSYLTKKFLMIE